MRFSVKTGAPLLALALALTACGTSGGDDEEASSGGGEAGTCEDVAIGFFGALTGSAANLGINIRNGAKLAVDQFNEENADCQVGLEEYDSAGDPEPGHRSGHAGHRRRDRPRHRRPGLLG